MHDNNCKVIIDLENKPSYYLQRGGYNSMSIHESVKTNERNDQSKFSGKDEHDFRGKRQNVAKEISPRQRAEDIKNTARKVRESAIALRETITAMREAGTLKEIGAAIYEAASATRATSQEIDATVKELEQSGVIKEIGSTVQEVTQTARHTAEVARGAANTIASEMGNPTDVKDAVKEAT